MKNEDPIPSPQTSSHSHLSVANSQIALQTLLKKLALL